MTFIQPYDSPLGDILLAADETGLTGLWFEGEKYFANNLPQKHIRQETPILSETKRWLDIYFTGKEPDFMPPLHPIGSSFRQAVWSILLQIPYGQTVTYGEIAQQLARQQGIARMSAQAVGGAVGHNEISILIPCDHWRSMDSCDYMEFFFWCKSINLIIISDHLFLIWQWLHFLHCHGT